MKPFILSLLASVVVTVWPAPAVAQKYEGVAVKSGQAAFKFAGKDLVFNFAEGGFQQMQGFTYATLVFRPDPKGKANTHLNLNVMFQGPGKVDLEGPFSMNGIGMFADGDVSRFTKGKSKCTITLTKATATEVEGTADCPLLHNIEGKVMPPLTNLRFSATTR